MYATRKRKTYVPATWLPRLGKKSRPSVKRTGPIAIGVRSTDRPIYSTMANRVVKSKTLGSPYDLSQHLSWFATYNLNNYGAATGFTDMVFSHNSIYDPDVTGVGTTAAGHSEWGYIYRKYFVYGCKITATISNRDNEEVRVALIPSTDSTSYTSIVPSMNNNLSKSMILAPITGSGSMKKISYFITTAKLLNTRDTKAVEDSVSAWSANPTLRTYWHLILKKTSAEPFVGSADVQIVYFCRFTDPERLAQSVF